MSFQGRCTARALKRLNRCTLGVAITLLLAGCKVVTVGHTIGSVTSGSGAYHCPAGQVCEIDVVDIHFSEAFRGQAIHPNYRFKGWKKGDRRLCGGTETACALSTDFFADHPPLMDILQSDERFYLIPEFERIGPVETAELGFRDDGNPRVFDANDRLLGTLVTDPQTRKKGIKLRLRGYARQYIIYIEHTGFNYRVSNPQNHLAYNNASCDADPLPAMILTEWPATGLFPATGFRPVIVGPDGQFYITDPVVPPAQSTWTQRWDSPERECLQVEEETGRVVPLVPTDISSEFPWRAEGMETGIDRPFPDSLVF